MKKIKLGKYDVELYNSIDELPMLRFHKYNKMILIDSGIGSDLSDFDSHIDKTIRYIGKNPELASIELENMRQNVFFIQNNISPKHLAFAVLIKSVNGKEYNDISDDGLKHTLSLFDNVSNGELTAQMEAVKKKIDEELILYFPVLFEDATIKEYFDELKRRTMLMISSILEGETDDKRKQIDDITTMLLTYNKPQQFSGKNNMEIIYDKQFEDMCLVISQNLNINAKKLTVKEYYNAFEYIKKQNSKQSKAK